ncbi:hypothetical protein J1614_010329 [Plenodomus biglobosus]|nr:hypothetical protein J1614_010329 [Plenodomus biglobosus]
MNPRLRYNNVATPSDLESPSGVPIALLQIVCAIMKSRCIRMRKQMRLFSPIFFVQEPQQCANDYNVHAKIAKCKGVPKHVSRCCVRPVQLRSQHGTQIPNGNLHCICCCTFCLTRHVDGRPAQHQSDGGVDANCGKKDACVGHARMGSRILVGEQNNVADDGYRGSSNDEQSALCISFGQYGPEDCENSGYCIRWDSE